MPREGMMDRLYFNEIHTWFSLYVLLEIIVQNMNFELNPYKLNRIETHRPTLGVSIILIPFGARIEIRVCTRPNA